MNAANPIVAAALLAAAPAQGLVLRDAIAMQQHLVAFDAARGRLTEVGRQGEVHEFDGVTWLRRPGGGSLLNGRMCHRLGANVLFAFGFGLDLQAQTWQYDGAAWRRLQHGTAPPARWAFAMAHDVVRDRVVLFGGASVTGTTVFGDTWESNGSTWTQRAATGPAARLHGALAYDLARGVCVLFGGQSSGVNRHGDTWEWNGSTWVQRAPAASPPPRYQHAMAYDAVRARTVLSGGFGGALLGDVWEWDGVTWQPAAFTGGPGPRWEHDLVFDNVRGETLLVGGASATAWNTDVWQWNGIRWLPVTSTPVLPRLGNHVAAAPEPIGGGVLQFGSIFGNQAWRYRNGAWTPLASANAPPARYQAAMWSDGRNAWLFGGLGGLSGILFADTWRWTAGGWQQVATIPSPSPRVNTRVAFDVARNRAVLFGGRGQSVLGDTWTFDGATWQQQAPAVSPPPRSNHALAYEPVRQRVVLFGGDGGGASLFRNDTWEWNGSAWLAVTPPARPPALGTAAMEYDGGRMVLSTAVEDYQGGAEPVEMWSYDGVSWTALPLAEPRTIWVRHWLVREPGGGVLLLDGGSVLEFTMQPPLAVAQGPDCGALTPLLAGREQPTPGNAEFGLDVAGGPPASFVVIAASAASANVPVGACTLQLGPPLVVTAVAPTNALGFATHKVPLPAQPALVGATCWFQAFAVQPAAPSGFVLSKALRVTVGA